MSSGFLLKDLDDRCNNISEIVKYAVEKDKKNYIFASNEQRKNKELTLIAISNDNYNMSKFDPNYQSIYQ